MQKDYNIEQEHHKLMLQKLPTKDEFSKTRIIV